jgi:putative ABC transport system permease protein
VNSTVQDVRYAVRGLIRSPGFALVAILTLALGVGASTSIFSVVNGVLLRPLPFPESDRLVALFNVTPEGERDNHSGANFLDIRERSRSFAGLAGHRGARYNFVGGDLPEVVRGSNVTSNFFKVLGVQALVGRVLSPDVDLPGSERSVVLSYAMWQSQFGGDAGVLGRNVKLNDDPYTVVGVMPPGFSYPRDTRFWTSSRYEVPESPVGVGDDPESVRNTSWFSVIGRLAPNVTHEQVQAELSLITNQLTEEYPESNALAGDELQPIDLREAMVGDVRTSLCVLLGAVGFLLLIGCANVANLLLVRASAREREIAVRVAIGASRTRILRQLATESAVLALAGGVVGLVLALWGTQALLALAPDGIPRVSEVGVDFTVLGFSLVIALGTGLLVGLAPALQSLGRGEGRAASIGGTRQTASQARTRLRGALIVGEVAVSLLLLVGAGLMVRTLASLTSVDPGFETANTLTARVWIPGSRYQEDEQIQAFYTEALERVRVIPGVQSAGAVLSLPVNAGINGTFRFSIENQPVAPDEEGPLAEFQIVSADYFETIGIPLMRGRLLTRSDDAEAPRAAVVNEALAEKYWPEGAAIGKRIVFGDPDAEDVDWITVVGIVGNTRQFGLDQPARPEVYQPYLQTTLPFMTLVVKSELDDGLLTSAVRRAVMEVDPEQPMAAVATLEQVLFDSLGSRRFNMLLLTVFAIAALVLAAVGLFGVLSYTVSQRANEIGVRMALGARGSSVVGQIVRQGVGLAIVGVVIGTAGALALSRLMTSMIHGVSANDPLTFVIGALLLAGIAALASFVPALRASRVDPIEVLRAE